MAEKTTRLAFRISDRQESLIRAAAASRGMTITDFVLNSACAQAELALLDRNVVILPGAAFDAWTGEFDTPPREMPNAKSRLSRLAAREI